MARNVKTKQATPLMTLPLIAPGFSGLNTELANAEGFIQTAWASVLDNAVFDDLGRIASRKGYTDETVTPITGTPSIAVLHEWVRDDKTSTLVCCAADFTIQESTDDGATWSNISGDFTTNVLATAEVMFASFNNDLYATAPGFKVYRYTGAGTFTEITTSSPTRGIILATFGRLWVAEDATDVINYSALLDGTDWTGTASGSIDASNAWTGDSDNIEAIAAFGATLVVFGSAHILMYVDGAGSELGVDPDNLYVVDTIEGTGTTHKDSIVNIGEGDLWFLGPQGIQSLARVVQDKVNPLSEVSSNIKSLLQKNITGHVGSANTVQTLYSPENSFVLYNFPEDQQVVCFDTRFPLEDGTYRVTTWTTSAYKCLERRGNGDLLFGLADGNIGKYSNYRDDAGGVDTEYFLTYASPWLNFGKEAHTHMKILKSAYVFVYGRDTLVGTARWAFDYRPLEYSQAVTSVYSASGAEWGSGEWGSGEFGGGLRTRKVHIAGMGQGQLVKFYLTIKSDTTDNKVAIQEIGIRAKIGRGI